MAKRTITHKPATAPNGVDEEEQSRLAAQKPVTLPSSDGPTWLKAASTSYDPLTDHHDLGTRSWSEYIKCMK